MPRCNLIFPMLLMGVCGVFLAQPRAGAQQPTVSPSLGPPLLKPPASQPEDKLLPINLPTALRLANAKPLDIAIAAERLQVAVAQLQRSKVLWLPSILMGTDYFRHDGQIQAVDGTVFGASKSSFLLGISPTAVFAVTDAIFAPLAARQVVRAHEAGLQAASNDSLLAVSEAYFNVQQARGELAGASEARSRAQDLVRRAEKLVPELVPRFELTRTRAELAQREQAVFTARERWQTASAELARLLRLDASALVQPLEPPQLQITLVPPDQQVDDLIATGLTSRPELAAQKALVEAALARMRQERIRPLVPSLLLRGASTNPSPGLGFGYFGGGTNGTIGNYSVRSDFDIQLLWQLDNLGFGYRARVNETAAEKRLRLLELFRLQDRVAAEVTQAYAQVKATVARKEKAAAGLKYATESVNDNFKGLEQTQAGKRILAVRPQEAVAAVQTLGQAYANFFAAVGDYNRAQFRLYRAMGNPASLAPHDPKLSNPVQ